MASEQDGSQSAHLEALKGAKDVSDLTLGDIQRQTRQKERGVGFGGQGLLLSLWLNYLHYLLPAEPDPFSSQQAPRESGYKEHRPRPRRHRKNAHNPALKLRLKLRQDKLPPFFVLPSVGDVLIPML